MSAIGTAARQSSWATCCGDRWTRQSASRSIGATYVANVMLYYISLGVAQWVVESIHADAISVEAILRAIDGEDRSTCIRFGDSSIALHANQLCPYFVVNLFPLVENFQYVILWRSKHKH